jgi:Ser/Thr protein kinase RdoA (MazF antagonist)
METDPALAAALPLDAELGAACRAFFPDLTQAAAVLDHPDLARVETPDGARRVRRWPVESPVSDVEFSHQAMAAARAAGLAVVPDLATMPGSRDTILRRDGRIYDAQSWLPGTPPARAETEWPAAGDRIDLPVVLPDTVFREVVTAAALFHLATIDRIHEPDAPAAPLGLLPGAVQQTQRRHLGTLRARAPREPAIQRWLAIGERLMSIASPVVLHAADDPDLPVTTVHLGLWPAHVLVEGDALSGLIGWERAAVGSPLLDLAQAILRLHGWSDEIVETAIGAYNETRTLSPAERRLLPAVAALDAVAATGRLLEQTYGGNRGDRPPSPLRAAIDAMLRSMAALDRTLGTPMKPRRRVWHRQTGRPPAGPKGGRSRARPRRANDR